MGQISTHSAVSRGFIRASQRKLNALMERDLSKEDYSKLDILSMREKGQEKRVTKEWIAYLKKGKG